MQDGQQQHTVTVDEAMDQLAVIPDYDPGDGPQPCVHTFALSAFGLLGAHWSVDNAREFIEKHGAQKAGGMAAAMGHSLVVKGDGRTIFFETAAS
jgi:hypothetical protein